MQLYQLLVQSDEAWQILNELGKHDAFHFIDLNKDRLNHEQTYAKIIKKIEDAQRRLE